MGEYEDLIKEQESFILSFLGVWKRFIGFLKSSESCCFFGILGFLFGVVTIFGVILACVMGIGSGIELIVNEW